MISINIGSCSDDMRVVHKNFIPRTTITAEINFPCDELYPELIVSRETIIKSDNYCFIPYFGRYYYITDITHNGKTKILNLSVDVLKSYENALQEIEVNVVRNSGEPSQIADPKLPINNNSFWVEGVYFPEIPFTSSPTTISDSIVLSIISQSEVV